MYLSINYYVAMNIKRLLRLEKTPSYKLTNEERRALEEYRRNRVKHSHVIPKHNSVVPRHDARLREKSDG